MPNYKNHMNLHKSDVEFLGNINYGSSTQMNLHLMFKSLWIGLPQLLFSMFNVLLGLPTLIHVFLHIFSK
jgi:hypothetical protein